jgi:hypothetical protein
MPNGDPFLPSTGGFKFENLFPGYPLPFNLPGLPPVSATYGLCGGMSAAAYDFLLAQRPIPQTTQVPAQGSPLQRYLFERQSRSLGPLGDQVLRFVEWMALPDGTRFGTQKRTYDEFRAIRVRIDRGECVPIGLVYVSARDTLRVWENHQVLAYGYEEVGPTTTHLAIYDCNAPLDDSAVVVAEQVDLGSSLILDPLPRWVPAMGLRCAEHLAGVPPRDVRGFFAMPYEAVIPPQGL